MNEIRDNELEKVTGGAATRDELVAMVHTCPFCLSKRVTGGLIGEYNGAVTGWMCCPDCGRTFEVYCNETAVYENATDIYTKRWIDKGGKKIETTDFPDVQSLWE